MEDRPEDSFHDWEILPDHEFGSSRRIKEPKNHENAGFVGGNSGGIGMMEVKPQYSSSDPAADLVGPQKASAEDAFAVAPESEGLNLVDPCLESCGGQMAVETECLEEGIEEKCSDPGDFLAESDVSEPEKLEGEMGTHCCEEGQEVGGGPDSGGIGEGEFPVAEEGSKERAWWMFPFQFAKVFVSRLSPFWSLSVGVVAMGFLMLGRRWYKAKRVIKSSPITICVEDKRASQFMTQAARLNEAFSVVRCVPVIRSSVLSTGASSWPAIALK
ncbi:uncharacterized protein LOC116258196 isoform X2 [Nymphaea colorata]|uniref:uncharacterized protein LOC116258196 isoform X2 n=1 Tax=Nymphaea colorata TaxID=210225 RepID=UPI00129E3F3E|nr:uncharacterized protein LOC116258196 isoform X2 [Nymphaea colorata]